MDRDFWLARWDEGKIGFHQADVNPTLARLADRVAAPGSRVLVPLAGKSNDMAWLAHRGDTVVGVELSQKAVEAFYEEHRLTPTRITEGRLLRYDAGGVTLYVGDFFDLTPEHLGDVAWVFDRAAYYALPETMRERYAAHLTTLLGAESQILLLTLAYDQSKAAGPPFAIPEGEVMRLFGASFTVESLGSAVTDVGNARLRDSGVTDIVETTWLLQKTFSR